MVFYCNACKDEQGWPESTLFRSYGKCEVCGKHRDCNDVPSSVLPPVKREVKEPVQ